MSGNRTSQSINYDSSGSLHSAGIANDYPGRSETASNVSPTLIDDILHAIMQDITSIVETIPPPSIAACPAPNKKRREEMRSSSFGPTVHTLQRAYSKLLHETFENKWSAEISANVDNLAAAIVWKLSVHSNHFADEGETLIHFMLEHLQMEFKWEKLFKFSSQQSTLRRVRKNVTNMPKPAKTTYET